MKKRVFWAPLLALGFGILAHAQTGIPSKVGIIHIQNAIIQTKDGQKAASEMEAKFAPKRQEFDKRQGELAQLESQYRQGVNMMSEDAKQKLAREIDQKRKALQRDTDDAQADLEQDQNRVLQELGQKMMGVIIKYAKENGFALILDVSSPQTPVVYFANGIDITSDIIGLYDKANPASAPAATSKPASLAPATSAPPPKPAAPSAPARP